MCDVMDNAVIAEGNLPMSRLLTLFQNDSDAVFIRLSLLQEGCRSSFEPLRSPQQAVLPKPSIVAMQCNTQRICNKPGRAANSPVRVI